MRYLRWLVLAAVLLITAACTTPFYPGRCDHTSDCSSMSGFAGYVCDLDPNVQGNGRCVPPCNSTADCQGGRVCNFDSQGVGRCLFSTDGGVGGAGASGGASGRGGGAGGGAGAHPDASPDVNPCA